MICPSCKTANADSVTYCGGCGAFLGGLVPGSLIDSRYEIIRLLGRGGMGMVYEAQDHTLDERVALKVLRPDPAASDELARRFRSEIKLARKVRHPNVCGIHDYGEDNRLQFISMELIEGADLKALLRRGALPADEIYEIAIQVAQGLQAVHRLGIVHRDLKTSNIMRDLDGTVRLMDFGIARRVTSEGTDMTATGHVVGTPEYMSPEQARGSKVDQRSDIYSFGVVVFEICTGRVPFQGETPVATILKHLHEPVPLAPERTAGIPAPLVPVLYQAMAKDPAQRYQDMEQVLGALDEARAASAADPRRPDSQRSATPTLAAPPTRAETPAAAPATSTTPTALEPEAPMPTSAPRPDPAPRPSAVGAAPGTPARPQRLRRPSDRRVLALRLAAVAFWILAAGGLLLMIARLAPKGDQEQSASVTTPPSTLRSTTDAQVAGSPLARPAALEEPPEPTPTPTTRAVRKPVEGTDRQEPLRTSPTAVPPVSVAGPTRARSEAIDPAPTPVPITLSPAPSPTPHRLEPPVRGWLKLVVAPWAEVKVDGETVGTTPLEAPLELSAGKHVVQLEHPEYFPLKREVSVRAGETVKLDVDFSWEGFKRH